MKIGYARVATTDQTLEPQTGPSDYSSGFLQIPGHDHFKPERGRR